VAKVIIDSVRNAVQTTDLVVTTGGIGSTHDDITYASIAAAFDDRLELHQPTVDRMFPFYGLSSLTSSRLRMARFPSRATAIFPMNDLWVPIVVVEGKCHIFPGIPSYFTRMLHSLRPLLPDGPDTFHVDVYTAARESDIADYLRGVADEYAEQGIEIGSYPNVDPNRPYGVRVSIIGFSDELVEEVAAKISHGIEGFRTLPTGNAV
jgi:molybdopterin-biosynthesis enzyme MoeA-like protein